MEELPKKARAILRHGFSLNNPVGSAEAVAREESLKQKLERLSLEKRVINTKGMLEHMTEVGRDAGCSVVGRM